MRMIDEYRSLIKALGPQASVARMLGIPRRNVWWWLNKGQPSRAAAANILAHADRLGIQYDKAWSRRWIEELA